jgi:hypothetical protein
MNDPIKETVMSKITKNYLSLSPSETQFVSYPTSKIVQFTPAPFEHPCTAYALCENGSVWEFLSIKGYRLVSAPLVEMFPEQLVKG